MHNHLNARVSYIVTVFPKLSYICAKLELSTYVPERQSGEGGVSVSGHHIDAHLSQLHP